MAHPLNAETRLAAGERSRRYPMIETAWRLAGREWRIRSVQDQDALLRETRTDADLENFPYGLALWASAVGLAQRLAQRPERVYGKRILEIGAGVGLAGLVARHLGANVAQTDYLADALDLCRTNAALNGLEGIIVRPGDWRDFPADIGVFDLIIGSDVLYERTLHSCLASLLPRLVAPGGRVLLSDPLRPQAFDFVAQREAEGWEVEMDSEMISWEGKPREIAFFGFPTVSNG